MPAGKRIVLVTNEILGLMRNGGAGTANTFLSFALAELGHHLDVLYIAPATAGDLDPSWAHEYAQRGIRIRFLERSAERVLPEKLGVPYDVERHLRSDPPDLVIAHDQSGPAYTALRTRELGLGFSETLFVVYCHGTTQWIYDAHRKIRRSPASFELEAVERASVELADVVVSPSAYMLEWMRARRWRLPQAVVAPYLTRTRIDREHPSKVTSTQAVSRLVFFGRLEERKGLGPFVEALNRLPPVLLRGIELVFLGRETVLWPPDRVRDELSNAAKAELKGLRFETNLDQPEALALLKQPGTLAVMPSLVDNSPNVIYECLEHSIPFLASDAGGGPELVAPDDRDEAFFEPTATGVEIALAGVLRRPASLTPRRPAFDTDAVLKAWAAVISSRPAPTAGTEPVNQKVSAVVSAGESAGLERCLAALQHQTRPPDEVLVGNEVAPGGDLVLLLHAVDQLEPPALETLLRALAASESDVVTCGVRTATGRGDDIHLFLGDARELGVIANHFGLVGLYRYGTLLAADQRGFLDTPGDADWLLLASLALDGAKIVSVPATLVRTRRSPGAAATDPIGSGTTLAVVRAYERASPPTLEGLPRLAAALAARRVGGMEKPSLVTRARWIWANEGAFGLARRLGTRTHRLVRTTRAYPGRISERARRSARQGRKGETAPKAG